MEVARSQNITADEHSVKHSVVETQDTLLGIYTPGVMSVKRRLRPSRLVRLSLGCSRNLNLVEKSCHWPDQANAGTLQPLISPEHWWLQSGSSPIVSTLAKACLSNLTTKCWSLFRMTLSYIQRMTAMGTQNDLCAGGNFGFVTVARGARGSFRQYHSQ